MNVQYLIQYRPTAYGKRTDAFAFVESGRLPERDGAPRPHVGREGQLSLSLSRPTTMTDTRLRLLTFNCWYVESEICSSYAKFTCSSRGLKYVSKHRMERIRAIASVLASSDYDIITLQELWVFADFEYVRSAVSKKLPYAKFFYRCVLP